MKHQKKALEVFSVTNVDIVFLDIDMPDMSGLELRKQILDIPVCIFTTDHSGYALDSFDLETLDYLLKILLNVLQKPLTVLTNIYKYEKKPINLIFRKKMESFL